MNLTEPKATIFKFKQFQVLQDHAVMKVGTDGILLGAWADTTAATRILDIGTGTGLIALMCAQKAPEALVDAVDIEEAAFRLAQKNFENSTWSKRLYAHHTAIQDFSKRSSLKYDLIVSNPPFFTGGTFSRKAVRNQMRHTIKLPTGDLIQAVRRLLHKQGKFCLILPYIEGLRFREQAEQYGFFCTKMVEVLPTPDKHIERLLLQFEWGQKDLESSRLIIENNRHYTPEYIRWTENFYLHKLSRR